MEQGRNLHINDLPIEMLSNIFFHLKRTVDLDHARTVCSLWRLIIHNTVGVRMSIGNGSEFWEDPFFTTSPRWHTLTEITQIGISACSISNIIDASTNPNVASQPITFLRPNLLRKLQFDGFLSEKIYQNLCSPLRNLTTLIFHASTLTFVEIQISQNLICQSLTTLVLSSDGFTRTHFPEYNMKRLFTNFCSICSSSFPRIKNFYSTLPIFLDKEVEIYKEISTFVDQHYLTLTDLQLRWTQKWRVEDANSRTRTQEELNAVNDALNQIEPFFNGLHAPSIWKLKSLIFVIEDPNTIFPTSLGIKAAIMLLPSQLERICYMCWNYIPMPVEMIQRNAATLKEIGLSVDDIRQPINCSAFSNCVQLTRLVMQADGEVTFDDLASEAPRLRDVNQLPNSLKFIRFRNIYIESHDVEWIVKHLPKLHTLVLVNIGRVDNLGITLPCLLWILKHSPRMRMLKVKGINSMCHMSTFGFHSHPQLHPSCPVCKTKHYGKKVEEDYGEFRALSEGVDEEQGIINSEDRDLLNYLFSETDHQTKFIPMIRKDGSVWSKF